MSYKGYKLPYISPTDTVSDIEKILIEIGWELHDLGDTGKSVLTFTARPTNNQTFTINSRTYIWKTTLSGTTDEVLIGVDVAETADNAKLAINGDVNTYGVKHYCATENVDVIATTNTDTSQTIETKSTYSLFNVVVAENSTATTFLPSTTDGTTGKVYKSRGEDNKRPYMYLNIDYTSTSLIIKPFGYWDETTHVGSLMGHTAVNCDRLQFANKLWSMFGSKDWIVFNTDSLTSSYQCVKLVARPTHFIDDDIMTTTTDVSTGFSVSASVNDSTGFHKGMYCTIWGVNGEGRDKIIIEDVIDGTSIIITQLLRNYSSGAYIGIPAMCYGATNVGSTQYQLNDVGYFNLVGTNIGTSSEYSAVQSIFYSNINAQSPDTFTSKYVLTPILIVSGVNLSLIGYIADGNIGGVKGVSINNIIGINDNGSLIETGSVTSNTNTTLSDDTKSWVINSLSNRYVVLSDGTGSSQIRKIISNTATEITVQAEWTTNPDVTTAYKICDKAFRVVDGQLLIQTTNCCCLETDHIRPV